MIFLDETESLVRVYEREAEDEDVVEVAIVLPASIAAENDSSYPDELPSLSTFQSPPVSLSPTSTKPNSQAPPSSPQKRRRLVDENLESNQAYHESPIAFINSSLHLSPSVSHHSHHTSFDFGQAFDTPHPGSVHDLPSVNTPDLHHVSTEISSRIETGLSPTYIETAIWPLSSIEEAKLMRYFVDRLAVWVGHQNSTLGNPILRLPCAVRSLRSSSTLCTGGSTESCDLSAIALRSVRSQRSPFESNRHIRSVCCRSVLPEVPQPLDEDDG